MTPAPDYIRWFDSLSLDDAPLVGGKTASLGELRRLLANGPVTTPDGFAVTAQAYRDAMTVARAWEPLAALLAPLDMEDVRGLARVAKKARTLVYDATGEDTLREQILSAYRALVERNSPGLTVAVRSSATAVDLSGTSFAGQHESFLHIKTEAHLVEACRRCFASLFTDRAIAYRAENGFEHLRVALSVAVMKMVRSDDAVSGVMFTLDTETGFRDVVFIAGAYGLGENIVQGQVGPDEFHVHKPTYRQGFRAVLRRSLGTKETRLRHHGAKGVGELRRHRVTLADRARFCLEDAEVLDLAGVGIAIEDHYTRRAGTPVPMDIEWAKDADDGRLYVVQARPETVAARREAGFETYRAKDHGAPLISGKAVGEKVASGRVRIVREVSGLGRFQPGEILVAPSTSPDWHTVMRAAAAIVTDQGGRTCHAAIVARELGVPAVVGTEIATARLVDGQEVTVCCDEGETGVVYQGAGSFEVERLSLNELPRPRTQVMVNLAHPSLAFRAAQLPVDGVGLARLEFIIGEQIRLHPMAAARPERIASSRERSAILKMTGGAPRDYFVRTLAEGVGTIAAAFHPRPVIVRLSAFKTNEYARLPGGGAFEPAEENPMLGFRGASRYAHLRYADGFALECAALKVVRETMGLVNLRLMIPFCRRVAEAERVLEAMADHGLKRGENGLEVYVMCEIPNNVIQIDAFAALFDGFSIGSHDLTQLVLGVDRDSEVVAFEFDERDPGVMAMLRMAVEGAKRNHRYVGICGEAPAAYPELAAFLTSLGVDSISVNPDSVPKTLRIVFDSEVSTASVAA
jgi:pyruvate,water dikinase